MKFIILGKNIEVTEGLKSAVEDKIGKLEKYFTEDTEVHVTLSVEKDRQKIEVTIPVKGSIIRSEQVSNDMYVSIDLVEEIIERQLKKYKTKLTDREQGASSFKQEYLDKDFMDEEEVKPYNPGEILPVAIFYKGDTEYKRLTGEHKAEEIIEIIKECL